MQYEPEMGQMCFGQPWNKYACSNLCEAALMSINYELCRIMWNIHQKEYDTPFLNAGNVEGFKNDVFEAHAYDWNENNEQSFNFKWKDVEISWYKHYSRGTSCNQELTPDKINQMLDECLQSLYQYEKENNRDMY